jgi:hypothetical protein
VTVTLVPKRPAPPVAGEFGPTVLVALVLGLDLPPCGFVAGMIVRLAPQRHEEAHRADHIEGTRTTGAPLRSEESPSSSPRRRPPGACYLRTNLIDL